MLRFIEDDFCPEYSTRPSSLSGAQRWCVVGTLFELGTERTSAVEIIIDCPTAADAVTIGEFRLATIGRQQNESRYIAHWQITDVRWIAQLKGPGE